MSSSTFFAYPASPPEVGQTIEAAVAQLRLQSFPGELVTWREQDVAGRFIADGVLERIDQAAVVVADISRLNFNVTYEIGYAIGGRRRVIVIKQAALSAVNNEINSLGIFDTLGYDEYETSEDIARIVRKKQDLTPIPVDAELNLHAPVYLMYPKNKSDQSALIQSRAKKAHLYFRNFDPSETPRLSGPEAIRSVAQSYGVLLHLIPPTFDDAKNHNLRAAFLAGLAHGMQKKLLLIQYSDSPVPLDVRDVVTYCRLPEDFVESIHAFAISVYGAIQESDTRRPEVPPRFLEQVNLGASSAENELTVLGEYYLEIDAFKRALRKEVRLITGRKGSGKTAIFFMLRDAIRNRKPNVVLDLKPDGYQLLKFKDQVLAQMIAGTLDHTITAFWEYLLLLEICYKLLEKDQDVHKRDHRLFEPYQRIRAAYLTDQYVTEGDFSERMSRLLHNIGEDFQLQYADRAGVSLTQAELTGLLYRHDVRKLRDEVLQYLRFKEDLWLLFDNIDKGWPTHGLRPEDLIIIRTLLEATRRLEREFGRANVSVHTVVFLRNDVYELLVSETPDRGKETRINVDWSEPDLLREMLRRRMVFGTPQLKGLSFADIWRRFCASHIKGEESSQYLIDRCLMRPRALIDLINHCRGFAVNMDHEVIEEQDVQKGLKAYSIDLLSDISLEMRDVSPQAENVVYAFIGAHWRMNETTMHETLRTSGVAEADLEEIVSLLLWFAFLGIVGADGETQYIYSFNYDMRLLQGLLAKLRATGVSYQVNPAFWSALSINAS